MVDQIVFVVRHDSSEYIRQETLDEDLSLVSAILARDHRCRDELSVPSPFVL